LDILVRALPYLTARNLNFRLIIAGKINIDASDYWKEIQTEINTNKLNEVIVPRIEFIPDDDIELYFNAADVLILPYRHIFQSGPLFMSYYFGLPVIASNVGSFSEEIIDKRTGLIFETENPNSLSESIVSYFESRMYKNLADTRKDIVQFAESKYSWDTNAQKINEIYRKLDNHKI
jgi:D-inositol-3-phosphate glycosyltransferase